MMRGHRPVAFTLALAFALAACTAPRTPRVALATPADALAAAPALAPPPFPPSALDKASFTASAAELQALAAAAPLGDWPVVVLREEYDASFDEHGVLSQRWRYVFVIRTAEGAAEYKRREATWDPTTSTTPVLRARVIAPDGSISHVDPQTVAVEPAVTTDAGETSVRRAYAQELPDLVVGAIVEDEVIRRTERPRVAYDTVGRVGLGVSDAPTLSTRITFSHPVTRPAKRLVVDLPATARTHHSTAGGRETWTYEIGRLEPRPTAETGVPSDVHVAAQLAITTGASWAEVARGYHALVEPALAAPFAWPTALPRPRGAATGTDVIAIRDFVFSTGRSDIDIGDSARVPATAAVTLARGRGDLLDRAGLLVALLRAAGVRADLALINRGTGEDVPAELPTLELFDHVLLRARLANQDVWLCPEANHAALGDLVADDRNRHVLVITPTTVALTRTPRFTGVPAATREVRTYRLAARGLATVTETTTDTGEFAAIRRSWFTTESAESISENLDAYVDSAYAGVHTDHRFAASPDLAAPSVLTVEAADVASAETARDQVTVDLRATDALAQVPEALFTAPVTPRRAPYEWRTPHRYEIENRIPIPDGYRAPSPLPADVTHAFGPAQLAEQWRLDGTTLVVTHRFDSGPARITPAQHDALTTALAAFAGARTVRLESTAWALADAGDHPAAMREVRRLMAAHPRASMHQEQRAYVLVSAGLGSAGQAAARAAVALAPRDARAHHMLAWTLERDALGRFHGTGFPRAAALAAYRRAHELAPTDSGIAADAADLLERGALGLPFERGADLPGAIAMWRIAAANDASGGPALRLATALFHAGQFEAVVTTLEPLAPTAETGALVVAAVAMLGDAHTAALRAAGLGTAAVPLESVLEAAVATLRTARHYDRARELAALMTSPQPSGFATVHRVERLATTSADPAVAVKGLLEMILEGGATSPWVWDAATGAELRRAIRIPTVQAHVQATGVAVLRDLVLSVATFEAAGAPRGPWRVTMTAEGASSVFYVGLDGARAKVIGAAVIHDFTHAVAGVGRHALRLLATGQVAQAAQLLDWVLVDLPGADLVSVYTGVQRSRDAVALGAARLAGSTDHARVVPLLARCAGAADDPARRRECDDQLAHALRTGPGDLIAHTRAWVRREPGSLTAAFHHAYALARARQTQELLALAAAYTPGPGVPRGDTLTQLLRLRVAVLAHDLPRAAAVHAQLGAPAALQNDLAWLAVLLDQDLPGALTRIEAEIGSMAEPGHELLNTRAAVYAGLGQTGNARTDLHRSLAEGHRDPLKNSDLYVLGRIAEQLGERATAIGFYRRVKREPDPLSVDDLVARRLAALD